MRKPFRTLGLVCLAGGTASILVSGIDTPTAQGVLTDQIVFVSRQIPEDGSDFLATSTADRSMPGVGGRERFRVAAPGRLLVRDGSGVLRTLIDGAAPTTTSKFLIDVSAPAVSYDGAVIAFAGLPAPPPGSSYDTGSHAEPGAWRIYTIKADGTGLRQVTFNDPLLDAVDMAYWGRAGERFRYDDTDPAWLPDGRIVFSSTRWMSVAEYGRARVTNLHVVHADGSGEHRITSERNGADRPIVDPLTGRIVFARWWFNGRFPTDRPDAIRLADRGGLPSYFMRDGLTIGSNEASGGPGVVTSNTWLATAANPDGTGLQLWTASLRLPQFTNNFYGGTFTDDGVLFGNFFPDFPLTESGGFGGIRRYVRNGGSDPVWGLTTKTDDFVRKEPPQSLTIIRSVNGYAADPLPLADGRVVFSWARNPATGAEDIGQDYGLFVLDPARQGPPMLVYDSRGTTELRAQLLRPRPLPPIIQDQLGERPTPTPIAPGGSVVRDGTFVFEALNVYANGPVDAPMVSAPAIGSAAIIRFFANYQRAPLNQDMTLNYPTLLATRAVSPLGAVTHEALPANVPLLEDLRNSAGHLPLTSHEGGASGGAFVTGTNFGRPGTTARCVGCHAGHTQIQVPATVEEARWTNLAPGAAVTASSTFYSPAVRVVNRRARTEETYEHWRSVGGRANGEWIDLEFPVPILVRSLRLYAPREGTLVRRATVQLFRDTTRTTVVAARESAAVVEAGTTVPMGDAPARVVRVLFSDVQGLHASLAEIEVIGSGTPVAAPPTAPGAVSVRLLTSIFRPVVSWTPSTGTGTLTYRIARDGVLLAQARGLNYLDSTALRGRTYRYQVQAMDRLGQLSPMSAPVSITIP